MIVYCLKADCTLEYQKYKKLTKYLSIEKYKKIGRFYNYMDAQRALLTDILVRHMICRVLKKNLDEVVLYKNEYGKPYINEHKLEFNASHSGEYIVAAINNMPVGIDIEQIKPVDMKIAERFFTKEEYNYLMSKDRISRVEHFYELWTLKESYIKAIGKGLSIPLHSFSISINDDIKVINNGAYESYYFKQYSIDPWYKMAVCSTNGFSDEDIIFYELADFYKEISNEYNIL